MLIDEKIIWRLREGLKWKARSGTFRATRTCSEKARPARKPERFAEVSEGARH